MPEKCSERKEDRKITDKKILFWRSPIGIVSDLNNKGAKTRRLESYRIEHPEFFMLLERARVLAAISFWPAADGTEEQKEDRKIIDRKMF